MGLYNLCSIFTDFVNVVRSLGNAVRIVLFIIFILLGIWTLIKTIRVNYNAKKFSSLNYAWFLLVGLLFFAGIFVIVV